MRADNKQIDSVQFLRAVAATMVAFMHNLYFFDFYAKDHGLPRPAISTFAYFEPIGVIGVPIFFVISGFIMAHLFELNPDQTLAAFIGRRLTRIVPLYWIGTGFCVWLNSWPPLEFILKSFAFLPTRPFSPMLGPGWTLVFEMMFYLLFGLMVVRFRLSVWCIAAAFVALQIWARHTHSYMVHTYAQPVIWNFFAGLIVHRFYRSRVIIGLSPVILAMGLAGVIVSILTYAPPSAYGVGALIHWTPPAVMIVLGCVSLERAGMLRGLFRNRLMQAIGAASYSIYLVHTLLFIKVNDYLLGHFVKLGFGSDASVVLLGLFAVGTGYLVHHTIELPSIAIVRGATKAVRWILIGSQEKRSSMGARLMYSSGSNVAINSHGAGADRSAGYAVSSSGR